MNKKIAYCGLNCQSCDAYLATLHNDQKLKEATAKKWARLNQSPILPEHIHCEDCRMPGAKTIFCETMCEIRKCAIKKRSLHLQRLFQLRDLSNHRKHSET